MAAGLAEHEFAQDPAKGPVMICDCAGAPRWQPLWANNPAIGVSQPQRTVRCGKGCLPYLEYPYSAETGLRFSPLYRAADFRGHVYLTEEEQARGTQAKQTYGSFIVLGSTPADRKNINRCWPAASWSALASLLQKALTHAIVQFDYPEATKIPGVPALDSPSFRDACGIMQAARLIVTLEGGLAFAAAAVGTPAVVLWGGCVSAPTLAFPEHVNLVDPSPETPCGALHPCHHCAEAWARLSPESVAEAVRLTLRKDVAHVVA
jgi:ADP-heptose:LPS heptosyltransferase